MGVKKGTTLTAMLHIENIHFSYKRAQVLRGVSLSAREGELIGVVGPNAAGKSTLLRVVSGVLRPARGSVRVRGEDLAAMPPSRRAQLVSIVPQNPQLPLSYRLFDLVMMGRNPYLGLLEWEGPQDFEACRAAMELTDTWRLAERPLSSLSGGERQRGLVAMALAQDAPALLLDEPTSSLDLAHQVGVMRLVRDVQRERGGAVVVAMHDLTLAAQYCDRLAMLAEGRVYAMASPAEVLTRENIERVYGAQVHVARHPIGGAPVVLPIG